MADSPFIFNVTEDNFQEIVIEGSRERPVLVDFWASWCNPCQMLMPVLARLTDEYQGKFILAKLNTEEQQGLAGQYAIRSIPACKLFRNGAVVDEFMGALPEPQVRAFLEKHIPRESDGWIDQALVLLQQRERDAALEKVKEARGMDPTNPRVHSAYAEIQMAAGNLDEAATALDALPPDEQEKPEIGALRGRIAFGRIAQEAPPAEELAGALADDPDNSEARYQLAAHRVANGRFEEALELLLTLLQKDRGYGDDAARKGMLMIFDMLGPDDPLVARYRSRMFNALH
ncbi:MAG TPA: thioredoxin [Chromatiales bacterium]|nr:thioredoxin [Chromatiales bacterium]